MAKTRILILAANPFETRPLALDEEYQRIQELWESSQLRDNFELRYYPALRGEALQEKVLKFKPNLIHFSGHGENDSLVFADASGDKRYEVTKSALAKLFKSCTPDLQAVFLNACHSAKQADDIVEQVDFVIGMNAEINDLAAIHFSQGFYTAIFTQETLDIEKAFAAGLTQMAITQISEQEQKKPVLQKQQKSFVPGFKHDVFINFADDDAQWANHLTNYIREQLKQKLGTADSFQLCINNDLNQLEHSATLLIITSPAYCQQYQSQFEWLKAQTSQHSVFSVEYDMTNPRPEFLKGFPPYKFWLYDDNEGKTQPLAGDGYFTKANELVLAIAERLKELNSQHQHQKVIAEQRQQQQDKREQNNEEDIIDAIVFLHSSPEDLPLTKEILPLLEQKGIDYMLPLPRSEKTKADDISQDIDNNILTCDAILILYKNSSTAWVREQLINCRTLQRDRKKPLKIIALHKGKPEELNCSLRNIQIYDCPSDDVKTYFSHFVEALKQ